MPTPDLADRWPRTTSVRVHVHGGQVRDNEPAAERLTFTKGHGTENDFVLVPDLDGTLDLTPRRSAASPTGGRARR
jgi:hypothetical protein